MSSVESHYSALQRPNRQERRESPIFGLRRFNNWVKSVLIQEASKHVPHRCSILDLACGVGGDRMKFECLRRPHSYHGIDVSQRQIHEAERRHEENKEQSNRNPRHRQQSDSNHTRWSCMDLSRAAVAEQAPGGDVPYTLVSCQFALHYAWGHENDARLWLRNITEQLEVGGCFIATIPNSHAVRTVLSGVRSPGESVAVGEWATLQATRGFFEAHPSGFGHGYRFTLPEAVHGCEEYIVELPHLQMLAREYGLESRFVMPFSEFYHHFATQYQDLLQRMQVIDPETGLLQMSPQEWQIAQLYTAMLFVKTPPPQRY